MLTRKITRLLSGIIAAGAVALVFPAGTAAAATPPAHLGEIQLNSADWSGSAGFGSTAPTWYEDGSFVVHLQGAAKQVSTSGDADLLGTLPPAARPDRAIYTIVHTFAGTYADLNIDPTTGQIRLIAPRPPAVKDYAFASLEGITFDNAEPGTAISLNTTDWSGSAGFGSRAPTWEADASGVVHLRGAARQVSTSGNADLLGTLPPAARPNRAVYAIVHTFAGTYADLSIAPNGDVSLIDPRPPAVKDYTFVSLEGVTYLPSSTLPVKAVPLNAANWSGKAGFGAKAAAWYADGFGTVHLQGAAKQVSSSGSADVLGTLPAKARPSRFVFTIVHTFAGTYADLSIAPTGEISLIGPRAPAVKDFSFVSLEGIAYQQSPPFPVNTIPLNAADWSGNAGFGSTAPGWYTDLDGIVHLQGAARQVSNSATADFLGTLPAPARPNRTVYTIVHTFAGTYADLSIAPNGQMSLIGPRAPAVKDYTFVSFEGVTYQPGVSLPVTALSVNAADWSGSAGFGSTSPGWYEDSSFVVHLEGAARQISTSGDATLLGTLPVGARPGFVVYTVVHTFAGTYADISIDDVTGQIRLIDAKPPAVTDLSFVSLEGVTFQEGPSFLPGNEIAVNSANWSGSAGFGSRAPFWFMDGSGVIHLEGAATQVSISGDANLLGTLPGSASPTRVVSTVVHTFSGTYADLSIAPNGQVRLIDPRPPAVKDYTFVSLEGITFQA